MSFAKRLGIIGIISLISVVIDQGTKLWAAANLPRHQMTSYLSDLLRIGYVENRGVFLGLGNSLAEEHRFLLFVVLVSLVLTGLLIYMLVSKSITMFELFAYSLILSGGWSNVYDRVTNNGGVIDFLNMGIGSLRTGIFNVADMAIMLGVILLLFYQFIVQPNPEKEQAEKEMAEEQAKKQESKSSS